MHVSKNVVHADVSIQELQNQVLLLKAQLQRSCFTEEVQQHQQQRGSLGGSGTTSPKQWQHSSNSRNTRNSSGATSPTHNSHQFPDDLLDSMSGMGGVCGQLGVCGHLSQLSKVDAVKTASEYVGHLELSLQRALDREKSLRSKLARERHEFLSKLDEYDWLCKSLEQARPSSFACL